MVNFRSASPPDLQGKGTVRVSSIGPSPLTNILSMLEFFASGSASLSAEANKLEHLSAPPSLLVLCLSVLSAEGPVSSGLMIQTRQTPENKHCLVI